MFLGNTPYRVPSSTREDGSGPFGPDESPAVSCFAECPHFEAVSGRCDHDHRAVIVAYFAANPDATCPEYDEWRAEQMAALARRLNSVG